MKLYLELKNIFSTSRHYFFQLELYFLYQKEILFFNDIHFIEESAEDICRSGLKLGQGLNKQEVVVVPKKLVKQAFFEKLFHIFK